MIQSQRIAESRASPWPRNTAAHRWYGFGRYYAMFPPSFAYDAISGLTRPGEPVLDPFCGRGNGPFTATVLERPALGIDVNPVAWLFTAVKLDPEANRDRLLRRLQEIERVTRSQDRRGRSRFERMAWAPNVRAFLKAARRELDWRHSVTDRTLMAFIALHMQDKLGTGLSNGLWPTNRVLAPICSYLVDRERFPETSRSRPRDFTHGQNYTSILVRNTEASSRIGGALRRARRPAEGSRNKRRASDYITALQRRH